MSGSRWTYHPLKCDGDFCPGDCDHCSKGDIIINEEDDLEIYTEKGDENWFVLDLKIVETRIKSAEVNKISNVT